MTNSNKTTYQSGWASAGGGDGNDNGLSREVSWSASVKAQPQIQASKTGKGGRAAGEVGVARSSNEPEKSESSGEPRGGTWTHAFKSSEGPGDGREEGGYLFDRITTPPKVRKLQLTLYRKAKAEPKYRFWSLYGDLCRVDVIETAMKAIAKNGGAAGVDGETIEAYLRSDEAWNTWRDHLISELKSK